MRKEKDLAGKFNNMIISLLGFLSPFSFSLSPFKSGFRFPLNVLLHKEVLSVKHSVGEERNPIAEDGHACRAAEHKVELDVAVSEDEEIDVGVRLQIFLSVDNKVLLVLAHIGRLNTILAL